jgi:hypothetical protein
VQGIINELNIEKTQQAARTDMNCHFGGPELNKTTNIVLRATETPPQANT